MENPITISQIPKTRHFNFIDCSFLQSVHGNTRFRNIGIRYVGNGLETYTLGDKAYALTPGRYLVGNTTAEGRIDIESKYPVRGVCIELHPELVSEVVASYLRPDTTQPDIALDNYWASPHFPVQIHQAATTALGNRLLTLDHLAASQPFDHTQFQAEFYLQMAELLVCDTAAVMAQMRSLKSMKLATRLDLFHRIAFGKLYLDEHFTEHCSIGSVAREVGISEFHFFRLFKAMYGLSPYQYLLSRRIECAQLLLKRRRGTLSEIALEVGFADIFSFSKAFKRITGFPPSQYPI